MPNENNHRFIKTLVGAGAALGGLKLYSDYKRRQFHKQTTPIGQFVDVNGLDIHYLSKGNGRPVVFIHGVNGIIQDFTMSMFDCAAKEFSAIAFDRPGHGHSQRLPLNAGSPIEQAKAIHTAIQTLGIEKPVIVGHSWGGALALAYAIQFPEDVSGIVVLAGYVIPHNEPLVWLTKIPNAPVIGSLVSDCLLIPFGTVYTELYSWPGFYPNPVPPNYIKTVRPYVLDAEQFRNNAEDLYSLNLALLDMYPNYRNLKMPDAIVHGAKDRIVAVRHSTVLHEVIPESTLTILPNAGHQLHYTEPDAVMDAIRPLTNQFPK